MPHQIKKLFKRAGCYSWKETENNLSGNQRIVTKGNVRFECGMDLCVFADLETDRLIWHEDSPALAAVLFCWRVVDWGRLPWWLSGQEFACLCRWCGFEPWVGKMLWQKKWLPTLVFLPGRSHGQRSLAGYSPWGRRRHDWAHTHTYTQSAEDPFSKSKYVGASTARIPLSYPRLILIPGILPLVPAPSPVWLVKSVGNACDQSTGFYQYTLAFCPSHPTSAQNTWGGLKINH